jgi:uncharacterized protein YbaR (Trm112 family)
MLDVFRHLLCEPGSNAPLELEFFHAIEVNGEQDAIDGIFYRRDNGEAYSIIFGVPVLITVMLSNYGMVSRRLSDRVSFNI